eukprot:m.636635 g.636635  ORF g.636635 m.636635 type:complete len:171 (+) comp58311_c1_seq3:123-635(+)
MVRGWSVVAGLRGCSQAVLCAAPAHFRAPFTFRFPTRLSYIPTRLQRDATRPFHSLPRTMCRSLSRPFHSSAVVARFPFHGKFPFGRPPPVPMWKRFVRVLLIGYGAGSLALTAAIIAYPDYFFQEEDPALLESDDAFFGPEESSDSLLEASSLFSVVSILLPTDLYFPF